MSVLQGENLQPNGFLTYRKKGVANKTKTCRHVAPQRNFSLALIGKHFPFTIGVSS